MLGEWITGDEGRCKLNHFFLLNSLGFGVFIWEDYDHGFLICRQRDSSVY